MNDPWVTASCLTCGRAIRPPRAKSADWPGTVKGQSVTLCQSCAEKERAERDVQDNDYAQGRHSLMLEDAVTAAKEAGLIDAIDGGMVSVARAAAYALDYAEAHPKASYAISHLLGPYKDALHELQMTPNSRADAQADVFGELLDELGEPS